MAVEADTPVEDVIRLMQAGKAGAALVCDADDLVGIFTERDVLRLLSQRAGLSVPVRDVMSADPATVTEAATVGEAIACMSEGGYRHLPLVDASNPAKAAGMVDVRGVMRYLVEHFPNSIYNLPPHPERATAEREGA
ncbi:CBS domain-containing protein [Botrimarina sp.]|uniref:CBS domain-containing protein n=1 Tax=Botrimarina sp. TaxID=2795802 RepID=UPI0032EEB28D